MNDETLNEESEDTTTGTPFDDSRFEVRWKKKETSSSRSPLPADTPLETPEEPVLQQELNQAQERIRELQDRWQRAAADLVNLRRRTEQEREDMEKFASMLLVSELLPVLDNFERALSTIPGNLAMLTWIHGVMLIERHMQALLEQRGLEAIDAENQPFNPQLHEAVSERETTDVAPGTIVQVYQKGYTMHGRVIRPALVEVAGRPSTAPPESSQTESTGDAEAAEIADEAETENLGP